MAIKVGNVEVISNSGAGSFSITQLKSYSNEDLLDLVVVGSKVGDFVINETLGGFSFWDGTKWSNVNSQNFIQTIGSLTYSDGSYIYEVFPDDGSMSVPRTLTVDLLLVGGGGGGGTSPSGNSSGGGGAGALISKTEYSLSAGDYIISVGQGGLPLTDGSDTKLENTANNPFSLVATGGGSGSPTYSADGRPGGSGGGGGGYNRVGGLADNPDYGNPGGRAYPGSNSGYSGGGGGAGGVGGNGKGNGSGDGGIGVAIPWLTGLPSAVGTFGPTPGRWFAGGGGGGKYGSVVAKGGAGGGGQGYPWPTAEAAQSNGQPGTGGGGGGGGTGASDYGGNGGSGVVIVRYPIERALSLSAIASVNLSGQSATWTDSDGNKNAIWINPGSFEITDSAESVTVSFVLIGGGGGGGTYGGGGGAGGVIYQEFHNLELVTSPTTFNVNIGAGGSNQVSGTDSTLSSQTRLLFTAVGGGRGGNQQSTNSVKDRNGGSGGGASWPGSRSSFGGSAEVGQGFKGGDSSTSGTYRTSGGGGATSAGENAAPNKSGNGGRGIEIDWDIPTSYGRPAPGGGRSFAGGGGGGGSPQYGHPAGTGGLGGGGNGGYGAPGPSAHPSGYGSGGGGGGNAPGISYPGGSGRKGIFILKWKD